MARRKRKPHYLFVKYRDGSQTYDRILAVTEDGMTIDDEGQPLTLSPNWLDDHLCWIDSFRHILPRPFLKHYKGIAIQTVGGKPWNTNQENIVSAPNACAGCGSGRR